MGPGWPWGLVVRGGEPANKPRADGLGGGRVGVHEVPRPPHCRPAPLLTLRVASPTSIPLLRRFLSPPRPSSMPFLLARAPLPSGYTPHPGSSHLIPRSSLVVQLLQVSSVALLSTHTICFFTRLQYVVFVYLFTHFWCLSPAER